MIHLMHAEARKLFSTRTWICLLLTAISLTLLSLTVVITSTPQGAGPAVPGRDLLTPATGGLATIPLFLLGLLAITNEHRHQTITPTLLTTPSPRRVLTAKALTCALLGAGYALTAIALQLAVALPWLAARHNHLQLAGTATTAVACLAVLALLTVLGMGLGSLLRNQALALTLGVLFLTVIGNAVLLIPMAKYAYPYLPPAAVSALLPPADADHTINDVHLLGPASGTFTLFLWAAGSTALGSLTQRREST